MKISEAQTVWAKIGEISNIASMGKDVIFFGSGCHLRFINLNTQDEKIYTANSPDTGDGIKCYAGHRTLYIFAFAENCMNPSIFVYFYQTMTKLCLLQGQSLESYDNLVFSEDSFLVSLGGLPNFNLTVWNWRKCEKVASKSSKIFAEHQMIKCSYGIPLHVAQLAIGTNKLQIWDVFMCIKTCILSEHVIKFLKMPDKIHPFTSILWTVEGGLFVLDSRGRVFTMNSEHYLELILKGPPTEETAQTAFIWFKSGLTISGPDQTIRHYKKSGDWINDWSVKSPELIKDLPTIRGDFLICLSQNCNVFQLSQTEICKRIKEYSSNFTDFAIINPIGEYILVICNQKTLVAYKVETGQLSSILPLQGRALTMSENPTFPYAAIGFQSGKMELISAYNPQSITNLCTFHLTKNPIDSIYFNDTGRIFVAASLKVGQFFILEGVPGTRIEVVANVEAERQIVDYMLVVSRSCYRLFTIPVTSNRYLAGNKIVRFCVIKDESINVKEYNFEDEKVYYHAIIATEDKDRDRVFYMIPFPSRRVQKIETTRGETLAEIVQTIKTPHQLKNFRLWLQKGQSLTWGYDGLVSVRDSSFQDVYGIALPHHRMKCGVKKARIDPSNKYLITLGVDNVLTCTDFTQNELDDNLLYELNQTLHSDRYKIIFKNVTLGFDPEGNLKGKNWLEVQTMKLFEIDRRQCEETRNALLIEFRSIQEELQNLLTENIEGPDNEKLDIEEFNLDARLLKEKRDKNREMCKNMEIYLKEMIAGYNRVSKWLMNTFWHKMQVPGKTIEAFFKNFNVENYPLAPQIADSEQEIMCIEKLRRFHHILADSHRIVFPWILYQEEELKKFLVNDKDTLEDNHRISILSVLENEDRQSDKICLETKYAFAGSEAENFIKINPFHYNQMELQLQTQIQQQQILSNDDVYKLKSYFNKEFDNLMSQKVREMNTIRDRNARFRHIISEINYFSRDEIDIIITDPEWKQEEMPELITKVNDKEIVVTPYISPSEESLLKAQAAEAERIRLLLLADDFKERALMAMMNGVLEVRWEDELKKEVPIPKCMLEKLPETFNEEDLKNVRDYEEKVRFLNSERERYKHLLNKEYVKIGNFMREGVRKFNERLDNLFLTRIKVESTILEENLKVNRATLRYNQRANALMKENEMLKMIAENDAIIVTLQDLVTKIHDMLFESRLVLEAFQAREKALEKAFKKELQDFSSTVQDQSMKLYKKRPKVNVRNINSVSVLHDLAKSIVNQDRNIVLTSDCHEYLKALDTLDLYVGVPPIIDEHVYGIVCKHRRIRIEFETKIRASMVEISEAETTISLLQKYHHFLKEKNIKNNAELNRLRTDNLNFAKDIEIQLVIQQGLVEIPMTGEIRDFQDAILISREDVEYINRFILKIGGRKIHAMERAMNFRRNIISKEWEHTKKKMQITDLMEKLGDIESVLVTKEMQTYLKAKARGYKTDSLSFETDVEMIKESYEKEIRARKDVVKKLEKEMDAIKENNKVVDKDIADLNVDVCEYKLTVDANLEEKEKKIIETKMKIFNRRGRLVQEIQKNYSEILLLKTELELLKLKTFPTLKYESCD